MQLFTEKYSGAWVMRNEAKKPAEFASLNIIPFQDVTVASGGALRFPLQDSRTRGLAYQSANGAIVNLEADKAYEVQINVNVRNHPVNYGFGFQLQNGNGTKTYPQCTILGYPNNLNGNYLGTANVTCTVDTTGITNAFDTQLRLINTSTFTQTATYGSSLFVMEMK